MNYHFSYLIGALLFDAAWAACFVIGKSYRRQIVWGTVVTAPLALTSFLFVPQYWTPPSLFDLDAHIRVGIEDFLWAGAVGGIASVVGELFLKERLATRRKQRHKKHIVPFVVMLVVFIVFWAWHPQKNIYNTAIAFAVCAVVVAFLRSDLIPTMLVGLPFSQFCIYCSSSIFWPCIQTSSSAITIFQISPAFVSLVFRSKN